MSFDNLDNTLKELTDNNIIPAISVAVGVQDVVVFSKAYGTIRESETIVNTDTRFDIASLTKIFTGICFFKLQELGKINMNDCISTVFPEMNCMRPIEKDGKVTGSVDAGKITWYQALTHTTGMGWARPKTRPSLPNVDKSLDVIFDLPYVAQPDEHIIYSDLPIILMGKAMEKVTGKSLDALVREMIIDPLALDRTGYLRISQGPYDCSNIAPTEFDSVFRNQRAWGFVHDENTYLMDGVAGHAGIFSTSEDMCRLAMTYNECLSEDGLLSAETVKKMISQQVEEDGDRRGLMWQLSGSGEKAYTRFLSEDAYGHAGFTGCFLWNDPQNSLSIVFLSNDVYNGRENRHIFTYRQRIMKEIADEIDILLK